MQEATRIGKGLPIPPWIITLIISIIVQVIGAAYVTGAVMARLDDLVGRTDRMEHRIDSMYEGVGPKR